MFYIVLETFAASLCGTTPCISKDVSSRQLNDKTKLLVTLNEAHQGTTTEKYSAPEYLPPTEMEITGGGLSFQSLVG